MQPLVYSNFRFCTATTSTDLDYLRLKVSTKGAQLVLRPPRPPGWSSTMATMATRTPRQLVHRQVGVYDVFQKHCPPMFWTMFYKKQNIVLTMPLTPIVRRSCYCCTYSFSHRHTCSVNCFPCFKGVTFGLYSIFTKVLNGQQLNVFNQKQFSSLNTTFFQSYKRQWCAKVIWACLPTTNLSAISINQILYSYIVSFLSLEEYDKTTS